MTETSRLPPVNALDVKVMSFAASVASHVYVVPLTVAFPVV